MDKIKNQRARALRNLADILPPQLISLVELYTNHGSQFKKNSSVITEEWIFSLSTRQVASALNCVQDTAKRWLVLAEVLGLVNRVSEADGKGIAESRRYGVGIQQFIYKKIDSRQVRRNWAIWINRGGSIRSINRNKIAEIFGEEVANRTYVHPEAFRENIRLRISRMKTEEERHGALHVTRKRIKRDHDLINSGDEIEIAVPTYTPRELTDEWADRMSSKIVPQEINSEEELFKAIIAYRNSICNKK